MRRSRYRTGDDELDRAIVELVEAAGIVEHRDIIEQMVTSALRFGRETHDRAELKLVNSAVKELRHSFGVFEPYLAVPKASIFGSARIQVGDPAYTAAREVAAAIAAAGWMVITGAGPGIMTAGVEGAGAADSFGVNIVLPFEAEPTPLLVDDPKLINFRYFFTRKLIFMKESKGFVLLPGGFGTMDEAFELMTLLQTGRTHPAPVVLLEVDKEGGYWQGFLDFVDRHLCARGLISPHDLRLVRVCTSVEDAVEELTGFYDTYHSTRNVGSRLIVRLQRRPDDEEIAALDREFSDIVARGHIERVEATESERRDDDVVHLDRIAFAFDQAGYSRLRMLIDRLNEHGRNLDTGDTPGRAPYLDLVDQNQSDAAEETPPDR